MKAWEGSSFDLNSETLQSPGVVFCGMQSQDYVLVVGRQQCGKDVQTMPSASCGNSRAQIICLAQVRPS